MSHHKNNPYPAQYSPEQYGYNTPGAYSYRDPRYGSPAEFSPNNNASPINMGTGGMPSGPNINDENIQMNVYNCYEQPLNLQQRDAPYVQWADASSPVQPGGGKNVRFFPGNEVRLHSNANGMSSGVYYAPHDANKAPSQLHFGSDGAVGQTQCDAKHSMVNVYNCGTKDLSAEQKPGEGGSWEPLTGMVAGGRNKNYSVIDNYRFRLSAADGTTVTDSLNSTADIPNGATTYFWDKNGGVSFVGCQASSLGVGNCSDKEMTLQYMDSNSQWLDFVIDGRPTLIKSGTVLVTDIPGGVQLRLMNNYDQRYTNSYNVPVDSRNYPSTIYFRADGTTSTGGCAMGVNSVSIYNSYNVAMEIQIQSADDMWQNGGTVGPQSTATIMVAENSSVRLVNDNKISGVYNSQLQQKQVYFRSDGSISNFCSMDYIHLDVVNYQEYDLNMQIQNNGTWSNSFNTKVVKGKVNRINVKGGSQMRFVGDNGLVASEEWTVPANQDDISTLYITEKGYLSINGYYNKNGRKDDHGGIFSGGILAIIIVIIIIIVLIALIFWAVRGNRKNQHGTDYGNIQD